MLLVTSYASGFVWDFPVLRQHSDRGGKFSSDLLAEFYRDKGIRQSFTLLASPQQNGIAERRIGLIIEVACTSMIHAAAPHFLWPFAVRYAAHQLNLWPRVSEPETLPTLRWTGKVGNASVFQVWGVLSHVRDAKANKLSSRTLCCVFLGFPTNAPPWQFYHPRERRVFSSQDVTFDEPPPPTGSCSLRCVSVRPTPLVEPLKIASDSSGVEPGGAETEGEGSGGAGSGGTATGGAATGGADFGCAASPSGGGAPHSSLPPPDSVLRQVLSLPSSSGLTPPLLCPSRDQSQPQLLPGSPLRAPTPHTKVTESLTEGHEPKTRASTHVRARRVACPRPLAVPGTHGMALRPSSVPQHVVLPKPPASSLLHVPDPESDLARAASPTDARLLATIVTGPNFESTAAFALVTEVVDFAARIRLDYIASLVTESESVCPPSVGSEPALSSDVLEDRHFELECIAAALPRFASMLLCPEGDPDALDIPTLRSYAEEIAGEYSSQWQIAMDAEMASWKSTGTYVDEVPPPGANIVDGM
ncbi:unnamed protein product [Closterium sp. NIES-53]